MSPYTTNVVDEMARLQQQNIQRNLMPQLKAGFVGTGGLGSTRYANAMGQTLADMQSNLTGQQFGALNTGYNAAVTAAMNNAQLQNQAARTQGDLATSEQTLGLTGAGALTKAGTEQQLYNQSLIDAPLKTATNVAGLMRGYTVPGGSTTATTGPMQTSYYQGSPLAQTLGLASSIASGFGSSPVLDAQGRPTYDPSGNPITRPNSFQKIFDSTGISGLASVAGSTLSDYLKSIGSGPDVSDPASTGQTGLPSNYTPPVDTTVDPTTGMNSDAYYAYYDTFS
jgi:hypothetical protein